MSKAEILPNDMKTAINEFLSGYKLFAMAQGGEVSVFDYLDADGASVPALGGQITDETKTFSNYSVLTANRTLTAASDTNYLLVGPIDVDTYVWDVNMVLNII